MQQIANRYVAKQFWSPFRKLRSRARSNSSESSNSQIHQFPKRTGDHVIKDQDTSLKSGKNGHCKEKKILLVESGKYLSNTKGADTLMAKLPQKQHHTDLLYKEQMEQNCYRKVRQYGINQNNTEHIVLKPKRNCYPFTLNVKFCLKQAQPRGKVCNRFLLGETLGSI